MRALTLIILALILFIGCQQTNDTSLTKEQELNVELASAENVVIYTSPPMIPKDHPITVTEDYESYENGGSTCLDCHNDGDNTDVPQTLHPERHNCVQCHIDDAEDLSTANDFVVENDFKKHIPKTK